MNNAIHRFFRLICCFALMLASNAAIAAQGQGYMSFLSNPLTVSPGDAASYMRVLRDWPTSQPYLDPPQNTIPNPAQQQIGATVTTSLVGNIMRFAFSIPDFTMRRLGINTSLTCGDRVVIQIDPNNAAGSNLTAGNYHRYVIAIRDQSAPTSAIPVGNVEPITGSFYGKYLSVANDWDVVTASTSASVTGFSINNSTYQFTVDIPLSDLGLTAPPPNGVGLAIAILNDLGFNTNNNAPGSAAYMTGTTFPLAVGLSQQSQPGLTSCGASANGNWINPSTWGQAYFSPPSATADVILDPVYDWVLSRSIKLGNCGKLWDEIGEAGWATWPDQSLIQNWYRYDQVGPCQMAIWIKAITSGLQPGQVVKRRFLVMWGRPGIAPQDWYVAGLTEPVAISGPDTKLSFIWNTPPTVTYSSHPCMRVYVLPENVDLGDGIHNEVWLRSISTQAQLSDMETVYNVPSGGLKTAQMNFNNLSTSSCSINQCKPLIGMSRGIHLASLDTVEIPISLLAANDTAGASLITTRGEGSSEQPGKVSKAARIIARGYGVAANAGKQGYVFIEPIGGLGWIFPNETGSTDPNAGATKVQFDITNPKLAERLVVNGKGTEVKAPPRKIFVDYQIEVAQGVTKPRLDIQVPKKEYLEPGETVTAQLELTAEPGACKCPCTNIKASLPANDNKLAGTEFLWVGIAGVGAFAFARRRNKSNKQ